MKVSALIPTYNRQAQVLRAIDSVLAQTVPVDEIIVVDDGSTDDSSEAIRSHYGSRVKLFCQENAGVSAARNRGIHEARGEWIALLDSDDVWLPKKIEHQLEAIAVFGDEFGVCFTDNIFTSNPEMKLSRFHQTSLESISRFGSLEEPAKSILAEREPFFTSSILVRRSLLTEINGFDSGMVVREDTDVLFRLSFMTKFCFVAETLVEIDRDPSREIGLCNLFATRDDRIYDSLERLWSKWLALPEVSGSKYEDTVREKLRDIYYDSAECKIHQLRIGPALQEIGQLREIGDHYPMIFATFLSRKIAKLRRRFQKSQKSERKPIVPGPNLA